MESSSTHETRVLILDDDPTFRRILSRTFKVIDGVIVVDAVATVEEAKQRLGEGHIDLVSLDVVLAEGSGLDVLSWVTKHFPKTVTLLMTAGQERRASHSLDAILLGASHLVLKPSGPDAPRVLREALERIVLGLRLPKHTVQATSSLPPAFAAPRDVVAIGASTGGPAVLLQFLKDFPRALQVPILVTQHLAQEHLEGLLGMLAYAGGRPVKAAQHGFPLAPGEVVVAGQDKHLLLVRQNGQLHVKLGEGPPENFVRPAVDPMFRSVADTCGRAAIGIVMTGMGADGAKGALALRAAGAPVLAQDQASSVVWGMPGAAVSMGAVNDIVPGDKLAHRAAGLISAPRVEQSVGGKA